MLVRRSGKMLGSYSMRSHTYPAVFFIHYCLNNSSSACLDICDRSLFCSLQTICSTLFTSANCGLSSRRVEVCVCAEFTFLLVTLPTSCSGKPRNLEIRSELRLKECMDMNRNCLSSNRASHGCSESAKSTSRRAFRSSTK